MVQHSSDLFWGKRWSYCEFGFCRRILHSKGELSEDRHKQYEEFAMSYQKLLANSQSLADLLDENMPDLPQEKPTPEGKPGSKASQQNPGISWDVVEKLTKPSNHCALSAGFISFSLSSWRVSVIE